MSYNVNVRGLLQLQNRLEKAQSQIPRATLKGLDVLAKAGTFSLLVSAPYDPAPDNGVIPGEEGHLRNSFYALPSVSTGLASGLAEVGTHEPIKFQYVTQGTLYATPIRPIRAKALWWPSLSHPVPFVRGQAPNPFQEKAKEKIEVKAENIFTVSFYPVLRTLAGI